MLNLGGRKWNLNRPASFIECWKYRKVIFDDQGKCAILNVQGVPKIAMHFYENTNILNLQVFE